MGSSEQTPILSLPQFGDDDRPTWRGDLNGAFNNIDAGIGADRGNIGNLQTGKADKPTGVITPTFGVYGVDDSSHPAWTTAHKILSQTTGWVMATDPQYAGANDTETLRNAIAAAGTGGTVWLGANRKWTCTDAISTGSVLTLLPYQKLVGGNFMLGSVSASATTSINFPNITGSASAITGAASVTMRDITVIGPGGFGSNTVTGLNFGGYSGSAVTLDNVSVQGFNMGMHMTQQFYVAVHRCEWKNNTIGLYLTSCYNTTLTTPKFSCSDTATTQFGTAISVSSGRGPISIFGGSIENYGTGAAIVLRDLNTLNLNGTYFETFTTVGNAVGISCVGQNNVTVNARGCLVMLHDHLTWIYATTAVGGSISANGNSFVCASSANPATPYAYLFTSNPSIDIMLGISAMDNWTQVAVGNYCSPVSARVWANIPPEASGVYDTCGRSFSVPIGSTIRTGRGITSARPALTGSDGGAMWYDNTLGKPIWWTGTTWHDATGVNV